MPLWKSNNTRDLAEGKSLICPDKMLSLEKAALFDETLEMSIIMSIYFHWG